MKISCKRLLLATALTATLINPALAASTCNLTKEFKQADQASCVVKINGNEYQGDDGCNITISGDGREFIVSTGNVHVDIGMEFPKRTFRATWNRGHGTKMIDLGVVKDELPNLDVFRFHNRHVDVTIGPDYMICIKSTDSNQTLIDRWQALNGDDAIAAELEKRGCHLIPGRKEQNGKWSCY
jgi:hypothetical protein